MEPIAEISTDQPTLFTEPQPAITEPQSVESTNGSMKLIFSIGPAKFDMFTKVLSILEEKDRIAIKDSKLCQYINSDTVILRTDIHELIGDNIKFDILEPKKYVKLFKVIKGDNDVYIYDDPTYKRFVITNDNITIFMAYRTDKIDEVTIPIFNDDEIGNPLNFQKDTKDVIQNIIRGEEYINLLIHQGQFKGIYVPETCVYLFPEFATEKNVNENTADILLKSYAFLNINGEDYTMHIRKLEDKYWITNTVNTGFIEIETLEELIPETTDGDALFSF